MSHDVLADTEAQPEFNELLEAFAHTLANPDGAKVLTYILDQARLSAPLPCSEQAISLHNFALHLLNIMAQASPFQTKNIVMNIFVGN